MDAQQSELKIALQQAESLSEQVDDLQVSRLTSHDCTCEVTAPYDTAAALGIHRCSQIYLHINQYLDDSLADCNCRPKMQPTCQIWLMQGALRRGCIGGGNRSAEGGFGGGNRCAEGDQLLVHDAL